MIPVLFESTEKEYSSNGLGRLAEASECIVTEERNGSYELSMKISAGAKHFKDLQNTRIIYAKPNAISDPQPFEIYNISSPMGGTVTVSARHISYRLSDIPCRPFSASSVTQALQGFTQNAMEDCPFEFWTDKDTAANYNQITPASIRERLGGVDGSILDCYGGEYEFDGYTVKLWNHRGADRGVTIRYGKNLTDAKQEKSIANTYTGIVGYWTNEEQGTVYTDVILSDNASKFPYHKIKTIDFSSDFQDIPTKEQLAARVHSYIESNGIGVPDVSVNVSFIDLADTEEYKNLSRELIGLCDTVTVIFDQLGINTKAEVTKTEYDVLHERYNSITLGTYYTLESTIAGISSNISQTKKEMTSELQKAKASATAQITGANGGYVRLNYDADGNPYEILVMDTGSIDTAKKVWRWNKNGLGYSGTGYNGEYGTAITQDGAIVADYITTGKLQADLIKAGILTDAKGTNFWNMETGDFQLKSVNSIADYAAEKDGIQKYASDAASTAQENAETYADTKAEETLKSANDKATELANAASDLARAAQNTADVKISTYFQNSAPTVNLVLGDIWIDTSDGNRIHRWNGKSWDDAQDSKIGKALSDASTAQSTADGKIVTYAQPSMPDGKATDLTIGDLWLDSDDNNKPYRWNGTEWVEIRDGFIQEAANGAKDDAIAKAEELSGAVQEIAEEARTIASGKITTYYQNDTPTENISVGDLWMKTGSNNNLSRWDGSKWVDVTDKGIADAMQAASTAQATADGKIVTYAQADAPEGTADLPLAIGDLWLDTDDNNHPYRWNGTSWVEIRDGFIQEAADTAEKNATDKASTALDNYDKALDMEAVFNKLTNNGEAKGIYMSDGELYINASFLKTGILSDGVGNNFWNLNTGEFKLSYANRISHVNYPFTNDGWWRTSSAVGHYTINDDGSITIDGTDLTEFNNAYVGIHLTTYAATSYKIKYHIKFDTAYTPITDEQSTAWTKNKPVILCFPYNDGKQDTSLANSFKQYTDNVEEGFEEDIDTTFDKPYETLASGRKTSVSNTDTLRFYLLPGCKYTISNVSITSAVSDATVGALNAADSAESNSKAYADSKDTALNQQEIFNRLTNNGESEGIYLQDGHLYINGSMIKAGEIDADVVNIKNLVVGKNVTMDANATISWSNVSGRPTNVSQFTNDSGYQTSTGVTTIANNCISSAWINANRVCIYDNNGTYHGTLGSWGTFNGNWSGVQFDTNLSVKGLYVDGDTNLSGKVWTGMERNYQGIYSDSEIFSKSWMVAKLGFYCPGDYSGFHSINASDIDAAHGYTQMSDRRMKRDIKDLPKQKSLDFVMSLRPVSFRFKKGDQSVKHGFIAQEVQKHEYDDWEVVKTVHAIKSKYFNRKEHLSLSYEGLIADLVSVVQQQEKRIEALEK